MVLNLDGVWPLRAESIHVRDRRSGRARRIGSGRAGGGKMSSEPRAGHWLLWAAAVSAMVLLACVLFWFDPSDHSFYPTCLLYRTTGLLCPGCGALRALHQLLRGHIAAALHFNALLVLAVPVVGAVAAASAFKRLMGQPVGPALPPKWLWLFAAIALGFGIWRNLPGSPFAMLPR